VSILLASCMLRQRSLKGSDMEGIYIYVYPSKEAEVITLRKDNSYRKDIYSNYDEFKLKSKPKYSNDGKWSNYGDGELRFDDWLVYAKIGFPDSILSQPFRATMLNVNWIKSGDSDTGKAQIVVFDQSGYIFEEIDSRNRQH